MADTGNAPLGDVLIRLDALKDLGSTTAPLILGETLTAILRVFVVSVEIKWNSFYWHLYEDNTQGIVMESHYLFLYKNYKYRGKIKTDLKDQ